jgi:S1-C subfamily serine protease
VGVRASQILLEINRRRVSSASDFQAIVATLRPGDSVALFIYYPYTDQRVIHAFTLDPQ